MIAFSPNPEIHHNNLIKHGLSLQTAQLVFNDPYLFSEEYDADHSEDEHRYYGIGMLPNGYDCEGQLYDEKQRLPSDNSEASNSSGETRISVASDRVEVPEGPVQDCFAEHIVESVSTNQRIASD